MTVKVSDLSIEERASLTSGEDMWHLQSIKAHDVPGYMITDGPHGLRKAAVGSTRSVPATCFPPAAGLSSSWNPELVHEVGVAMAEECLQEKVAVILGPGINIKRNPLGGRCFEFWSEDPVLAGHQAAALVDGVQSQGIGTSLKHFAANNQETDRMRVDARISERALREIYLPAFEYVIKHSHPWTVMCAYNKINGVYAAENHWLLTELLRDEWGFDGIVMSDWGACQDRVRALNAGLNLEMPPSDSDAEIVEAVHDGRISEDQLNAMAQQMLELVDKTTPAMQRDYRYDADRHHEVARTAARESMVLLKNENGLLPLMKESRVGVIGEFARTPRYQGGGSSHITPTKVPSFLSVLDERAISYEFAPGFTFDRSGDSESLTAEALKVAKDNDRVVMFLGLPESYESEGFDRKDIFLPSEQIELLKAVSKVNPRVAVVLSNGSVVSVSEWREYAQAIVESWLLGQAGGDALADVLFGDVAPSGCLSETIPLRLEDDPSTMNFPGEERRVNYGEGVFVGYRYYDTFDKDVAYPFGFGLSYTTFAISDLELSKSDGSKVTASVTVRNTGARRGKCTVQLYVAPPKSKQVERPVHELKAFEKVTLDAGESRRVVMELDDRAFAYWSGDFGGWHVEAGEYEIQVGQSSRDIDVTGTVAIDGDGKPRNLDVMSTVEEWESDPVGAPILHDAMAAAGPSDAGNMLDDPTVRIFFLAMPLHTLAKFMGDKGTKLQHDVLERYAQATGDVK